MIYLTVEQASVLKTAAQAGMTLMHARGCKHDFPVVHAAIEEVRRQFSDSDRAREVARARRWVAEREPMTEADDEGCAFCDKRDGDCRTCSVAHPEMSDYRQLAIRQIRQELRRQDEQWGSRDHDTSMWLTILVEELGEVAKAVLDESDDLAGYVDWVEGVIRETVQVAAVATAMIEHLARRRDEAIEYRRMNDG